MSTVTPSIYDLPCTEIAKIKMWHSILYVLKPLFSKIQTYRLTVVIDPIFYQNLCAGS